jgi:hypothetical protein
MTARRYRRPEREPCQIADNAAEGGDRLTLIRFPARLDSPMPRCVIITAGDSGLSDKEQPLVPFPRCRAGSLYALATRAALDPADPGWIKAASLDQATPN